MNAKLDNYLCKKYPKIFVDRNEPPHKSCMIWGFPGDGWFHLINNLCQCIQNHIDNSRGNVPQVVALQVKEKYSTLRFYYSGGDEVINGMVELAEDMSYYICEECGAFNETVCRNSTGWLLTKCSKCAEKYNKTYFEEYSKNVDKEFKEIFRSL